MFKALDNHLGFSLTEVMVSVFLMGLVMSVASYPLLQGVKLKDKSQKYEWIEIYRADLLRAVTSQQGWSNTVNALVNAAQLTCVKDDAECDAFIVDRDPAGGFDRNISENHIAIIDHSGVVLNDSIAPEVGYTMQGKRCDNHDRAGSDICPFRIVATWEPLCVATDCVSPDIRVWINFLYRPSVKRSSEFNVVGYNFNLILSGGKKNFTETCAAEGGVIAGETCITESNSGSKCGDDNSVSRIGMGVIGFDANNDKICGALVLDLSCGANEYLRGVDNAGAKICDTCP